MDGKSELEHCDLFGGCRRADGSVGEEEGESVQEGVWGELWEEEVRHGAGDILGRSGCDVTIDVQLRAIL